MEQRPNILFLFSDQHRGDWMPYDPGIKAAQGTADLELHMPNIRGMMDRGTAFTCAISPAPVCAPARACLASGRRYRNCRVYTNKANYDPALPNFYGMLRGAGYYVCGTGKFDLNKADLDWGDGFHPLLQQMGFSNAWDSEGKMDTIWAELQGKPGPYGRFLQEHGWLEAHREDMIDRGARDIPTPLPDALYADNWIGEKSRRLLADMPADQPWFMQVNFSGPHDPWDITVSMKEAVRDRSFPQAADCDFAELNQGVRQNYAAMIENIDRHVGRMLQELEKSGQLDNTLIVYAADHGEMMGDHSLYGKSKPEQGSIHIPLVIDASRLGGKAGLVNTTPVELQDLTATFLDYAGVTAPCKLESESLRPIVEGAAPRVRDYAISELVAMGGPGALDSFATILDGKYKLILRNRAADRLYDLEADPFEQNDLAGALPEEVARLRQLFAQRNQNKNPYMRRYAQSFHANG